MGYTNESLNDGMDRLQRILLVVANAQHLRQSENRKDFAESIIDAAQHQPAAFRAEQPIQGEKRPYEARAQSADAVEIEH